MTARIVRLLRPGGTLLMLVSASPRDSRGGLASLDPEAIAAAHRELGMGIVASRAANDRDLLTANSSWGKRLAASPGRIAWLTELQRPSEAWSLPKARAYDRRQLLDAEGLTDASDRRRE